MAVKATTETSFGEQRQLYIRLNNVDVSNHGVQAHALFRGFLSKEAFDAGKSFVWEQEIRFNADVSLPIWQQAYDALKAMVAAAPAQQTLYADTVQKLVDDAAQQQQALEKQAALEVSAGKEPVSTELPPLVLPPPPETLALAGLEDLL